MSDYIKIAIIYVVSLSILMVSAATAYSVVTRGEVTFKFALGNSAVSPTGSKVGIEFNGYIIQIITK